MQEEENHCFSAVETQCKPDPVSSPSNLTALSACLRPIAQVMDHLWIHDPTRQMFLVCKFKVLSCEFFYT